jgi:ribosomal protein S18 acetylase RimI-like enzyme
MVAMEGETVAGFAQLQSDGEIQAHLSLLAVAPAFRRRGLGRALIVRALREAGGERLDLLTDDAQDFYASLPHVRFAGFRLYPEYTGPDRVRAGVAWRGGRRVRAPPGS